jgi:hypothetical protein
MKTQDDGEWSDRTGYRVGRGYLSNDPITSTIPKRP